MPMKNPPHPGELVFYECIEPLGLTIATAAEALGVSRQALNNVVRGASGISAEMAVRLSQAFGSSPESWLRMQMIYDLSRLADIRVKRVKPPAKRKEAVNSGRRGRLPGKKLSPVS